MLYIWIFEISAHVCELFICLLLVGKGDWDRKGSNVPFFAYSAQERFIADNEGGRI